MQRSTRRTGFSITWYDHLSLKMQPSAADVAMLRPRGTPKLCPCMPRYWLVYLEPEYVWIFLACVYRAAAWEECRLGLEQQ